MLLLALRVLGAEIVALLRDLRTPPRGCFGGLSQLDQFELEVVTAALLRREREAFLMPVGLAFLELAFDGIERAARSVRSSTRGVETSRELGQLALPGKHTMQLIVRREEQHALRGHAMPCRRDERMAVGEHAAFGE